MTFDFIDTSAIFIATIRFIFIFIENHNIFYDFERLDEQYIVHCSLYCALPNKIQKK